MKGILIFIALFVFADVSANTFYVQDRAYNENASDINRGTDINRPWATWQKAFNTARAGDTVYFRGGTWFPKADNYGSVTEHHPAVGRGNNGTYANPICFLAYPPDVLEGNMPILDCRSTHPSVSNHVGLRIAEAKYLIFNGLSVTNVRSWEMESGEMWCAGILAQNCEHLTLDRMTASYVGGSGFFLKGLDTLYLTNCDAHHNCDSLDRSMPGGDGDGFNIQAMGEPDDTSRIAYVSGCRAWSNADDGFDIGSKKQLDVHHCWAWNNGVLEGDATGFKLCYSYLKSSSKRKLYNCISAYHAEAGFIDLNLHSDHGPFMEYYNNISYKCRRGFASGPGKIFDCNIHPASVIYRNNISYAYTGSYPASILACDYDYPTYVTQDHNSWVQTGDHWYSKDNPAYKVTDADFVSLDSSQLRWPRKADGSLPDITFLKLQANSDLIDTGIDVGLAFKGIAPDLGPFEFGALTVNLIAPTVSETFQKDDTIIIQARVQDEYNEISEVNFFTQEMERRFLGAGEQTEASLWQYTWESDTTGYQGLTAVAVNSENESATSDLVTILIYPYLEPGNEGECRIIPNPNNGLFILELYEPQDEPLNIQIVSMAGQLMANETMTQQESMKAFDLSHMGAGSYGVVIMNADGHKPCQPIKMIKN